MVAAEDGEFLRPLLNIDVTYKAFPKPFGSLIDLLHDMEREYSTPKQIFVVDLSRPLNDKVKSKLHAHLSGLELCYCSDGKNRRIYKYFEMGNVPAEEKFQMNKNDKKIATNVRAYFAEELKRPIKHHNLQCIRLGNKMKYISVPMEYCAILGTQVSGYTFDLKRFIE